MAEMKLTPSSAIIYHKEIVLTLDYTEPNTNSEGRSSAALTEFMVHVSKMDEQAI